MTPFLADFRIANNSPRADLSLPNGVEGVASIVLRAAPPRVSLLFPPLPTLGHPVGLAGQGL